MEPLDEEIGSWLEHEVAGCQFRDVRHGKRFVTLVAQLSGHIGGSIPFACQDWAATKAAYRFLSNARVDEEKILAGHFLCTRERFAAMKDPPVLVLHDTTEFSYHRDDPEAVGILQRLASPYAHGGQPGHHITCGILMHSSLVVTTDGLPLGLAAIKFWSRDKFHGANALKRSINPTRVPIEQKESYRWLENVRQSTALLAESERIVHIGDRESDIYELFSIAHQAGTHFLLRTCVDLLARSVRERRTRCRFRRQSALLVPDQTRTPRRLPRTRQRSTARKYRHVARNDTPHRYPTRLHPRYATCG
jgi:hypothetical protein